MRFLALFTSFLLLIQLSPVLAATGGSIGVWGGGMMYLPAPGGDAVGTSSFRPLPPGPEEGWRTCVARILEAERLYGIPDNYLLAIGLTESGRRTETGSVAPWPWTVNAAGEGRYFASRQEAMDWVRERQRAGITSIDVGCMQINLKWHPHAFENLEQGFDPAVNVDYSARLLKTLRDSHGSWSEAVGRYHSHTAGLKVAYRDRVMANLRYIAAVKEALGAPPAAVASSDRSGAEDPRPPPFSGRQKDAGLSWETWGLVARADGVGGLWGGSEFKPLIPNYE